jgi:hypothetical protein
MGMTGWLAHYTGSYAARRKTWVQLPPSPLAGYSFILSLLWREGEQQAKSTSNCGIINTQCP